MRRGEPQVWHPWIRRKFVMSCAEIGEHADKADFSESKGDDGDDGAGAATPGTIVAAALGAYNEASLIGGVVTHRSGRHLWSVYMRHESDRNEGGLFFTLTSKQLQSRLAENEEGEIRVPWPELPSEITGQLEYGSDTSDSSHDDSNDEEPTIPVVGAEGGAAMDDSADDNKKKASKTVLANYLVQVECPSKASTNPTKNAVEPTQITLRQLRSPAKSTFMFGSLSLRERGLAPTCSRWWIYSSLRRQKAKKFLLFI